MKFCRYYLLLPSLLVFSFIPLYPQEIQKNGDSIPIFQSKVRVVAVDVVVTNNKDKPVSGLIKNDFEILEDGHRQTISYFEEHKVPISTPVKLPPMPPQCLHQLPNRGDVRCCECVVAGLAQYKTVGSSLRSRTSHQVSERSDAGHASGGLHPRQPTAHGSRSHH